MLRVSIKRNRIPDLTVRERRAARNVNMAIAEMIAEEARLNVLRQGLLDSGFLFSSIVAQADPSGIRGESEVIVGAYYGLFHEFGTIHMRARPFLGPAVEKYRREYAGIAEKLLRTELEASPTATYDPWKGFYPDLGMPSIAALTGSTKRRLGGSSKTKTSAAKDPAVFGSSRRGTSLASATKSGAGIRVGGLVGSRSRGGADIPLRRLISFVRKLVEGD